MVQKFRIYGILRTPVIDKFLLTIPINPYALTTSEIQTAGEVEFYIRNAMYFAGNT